MILIVGAPRSGTLYVSKYLRRIGIKVNHEYFGDDGAISWHLSALPYMTNEEIVKILDRSAGAHVMDGGEDINEIYQGHLSITSLLHQVRDPLKVIPSIENRMDVDSFRFASRYVKLPLFVDTLHLSAAFWIAWNSMIEKFNPLLQYKVEEFDSVVPEICRIMKRDLPAVLPIIDKKTNTSGDKIEKWTNFDKLYEIDAKTADLVVEMRERYGYR